MLLLTLLLLYLVSLMSLLVVLVGVGCMVVWVVMWSLFIDVLSWLKVTGDDICGFSVVSDGGVGVLLVEEVETEMRDSTSARVAFALRVWTTVFTEESGNNTAAKGRISLEGPSQRQLKLKGTTTNITGR